MRYPFVWLLAALLSGWSAYGQQPVSVVTGRVTDAKTGEPVPFASVALKGKPVGTTSDDQGNYTIKTKTLSDSLLVNSIGYATRTVAVDRKKATQQINILLKPVGLQLTEVVIHAGENPAYGVMRKLRANRKQNDRARLDAYEYDSYAKAEVAMRPGSGNMKKGLLGKISKQMSQFDTMVDEQGKRLLPMLVSESVSHFYYRETPQRKREDILKTRVQGVGVQNGDFVSQFIGGNTFQNYNFYNAFLPFLGKDFVSPAGENWKGGYEFYLADTTSVANRICYEVQFDPRRKEDLAFEGKMWIDTTTFALMQIEAHIGKEANLNYVDYLDIEQELEPTDSTGAYLPVAVRLTAGLSALGNFSFGLRTKMVVRNSNFRVNQPRPLPFYDQPVSLAEDARESSDTLWYRLRHDLAGADSLNKEDKKARHLLDTLRSVPAVRRAEVLATILTTGWYRRGMIDIGPYPYTLAYNDYEGLRIRAGFRTNEKFSRNWVFRGYGAIGLRDHIFKYSAEVNYIWSRRHWTVAGLKQSYDIDRLGLSPELIGGNKLFYAFARFGRLRGAYFRDETEAFLRTEPIKGVVLTGTLASTRYDPLFPFHYLTQPQLGPNSPLQSDVHDTRFTIEVRLSRGETYIMDGNERITLGTKRAPVLTLRYTRGIGGMNGSFNYNRYLIRLNQSFRVGTLGRSTYVITGGYTPNTLPAILLFPQSGNPTPFFNNNTFNLMRLFEFTSDLYATIHYEHQFDGLLFNRIPLIKRLGWRLIVNADALMGSLSDTNDKLTGLSRLPDGREATHFGYLNPKIPYLEASYGIDNIFRVFRIQAIHRLTYPVSVPNANYHFGIKGALHFSF